MVEGGKEVDVADVVAVEDVVDVVMVEADTEVDAVQSYKSVESPNLPCHATELAPKFLETATGLSIVS